MVCVVMDGLTGLQNLSVIPQRSNTDIANVFLHLLLSFIRKSA